MTKNLNFIYFVAEIDNFYIDYNLRKIWRKSLYYLTNLLLIHAENLYFYYFQSSIKAKENPLKVAETRLTFRAHRYSNFSFKTNAHLGKDTIKVKFRQSPLDSIFFVAKFIHNYLCPSVRPSVCTSARLSVRFRKKCNFLGPKLR